MARTAPVGFCPSRRPSHQERMGRSRRRTHPGVGPDRRSVPRPSSAADVDLGRVALLPGLVNAHTHLELCWHCRRGASCHRFTEWLPAMMSRRREHPDAAIAAILESSAPGHPVERASGVALVGDVSNTLVSVSPAGRSGAGRRSVLRADPFNASMLRQRQRSGRRQGGRCGVPRDGMVASQPRGAAPYSVSPRLFARFAADPDDIRRRVRACIWENHARKWSSSERGRPVARAARRTGSHGTDAWEAPGTRCDPLSI